jgi:hypothetical protein
VPDKAAVVEALDHPLIFLVVIAIGVASVLCIFAWIARSALHSSGATAFLAHP